jgi:sigma-B regulation protein RsbU (phosphoserine phosphatase)
MASFIDGIRTFFKERKGSRLILILLTALLLELVAALQYTYTRNLLIKEEERITRMELTMESEVVLHTLEEAELSMFENEWSVRESLAHPDSLFGAVRRMIESNSNVAGACIAVLPDYYPEKGRLFEPYAHREEGRILVDQIAGPDHDYTLGPYFQQALREEKEFWSDPYDYGTDPVQQLITYSYPVRDRSGRLAAICGLDIDLTWLSDTLNVHPYYPSSFGFMLTRDGRLVAGPREERVSPRTMEHVASLVMDPTVDRTVRGLHRVSCIVFRDPVSGKEAYLDYRALPRDPGWIIAEVSYRDEVLAPVRRMMWRILLMSLAGFAFLLVIIHRFARNGKRLWEADVKQARIGSELRIARRIQEEMLPKAALDRSDLTARGSLTPAKEVGGDLFDYYIREEKLFFCIGDVCGKGVPAAMVMAVTHSILRMLSEQEVAPARIVAELNREACRNNASGTFVTLFLGVLDLSTGLLRYCNAGHDRPVLVGDSVEELPALANVPVGVFDDVTYQEQEAMVAPGSLLFLYTDGVTESMDAGRRQFGRERLLAALAASPREPEALIRAVGADIRAFAGEAEQSDDLTMLAVHYHPNENTIG